MKFHQITIAVLLGLAAHRGIAASAPTNSFGIYLFAESVYWRDSATDWTTRALSPKPVISEADIVAYTFTNHLMTLTSDAFQRVSRFPISHLIEPFVVMANGERIYRSVFVSEACSQSIPLPTIAVSRPEQIARYTNLPPEKFRMLTNFPPNSAFILRTYAAPFKETDPDSRSDDRVRRALDALHKLK